MKIIVLMIFLFLSFYKFDLYAKKIDKESIRIENLDADDDFFNNLQKIRNNLEEKDRILERKRAEIEELIKEIDKREKEIKRYETNINDNIKAFSVKTTNKLKLRIIKLTKIFQSMKPKNVARIIENLKDDLVIAVFLKLKEDDIGKIMKYLSPKKAAVLSEKLAQWRKKYKINPNLKKK